MGLNRELQGLFLTIVLLGCASRGPTVGRIQATFPPLPEDTQVDVSYTREDDVKLVMDRLRATPGNIIVGEMQLEGEQFEERAIRRAVLGSGGNAYVVYKAEKGVSSERIETFNVHQNGMWQPRSTTKTIKGSDLLFLVVYRREETLPKELRVTQDLDGQLARWRQRASEEQGKRAAEQVQSFRNSKAFDDDEDITPEKIVALRALFSETFATEPDCLGNSTVKKIFPGAKRESSLVCADGRKVGASIHGVNGFILERYQEGKLSQRSAAENQEAVNHYFLELYKDGALNLGRFYGKKSIHTEIAEATFANGRVVKLLRKDPKNTYYRAHENEYDDEGKLLKSTVYGPATAGKQEISRVKYYTKGTLTKEEIYQNGRVGETKTY